jgi:glutamate--cysteine ligase
LNISAPRPAAYCLLVPESHTRNIHYLENLATFVTYLELAGFQVRSARFSPRSLLEPQTISLPSGRQITLFPLTRDGDKIKAG